MVMKTFGSELWRRTASFCRRGRTVFPVISFVILFELIRSIEGNETVDDCVCFEGDNEKTIVREYRKRKRMGRVVFIIGLRGVKR